MEFKYYEVRIKGLSPLLMHRFSTESYEEAAKPKRQIPTPEEYARQAAYFTRDGSSLMIPAENLHRCLVAAASAFRVRGKGRQTLKPLVSGSLMIEPEEIPLGTTKYEIDIRSAVVQRSRILRARPKVWPWRATFILSYPVEDFPAEFAGTLKQLINDAGRRIGLLDFRPATGGRFGRFYVEHLKEVDEAYVEALRASGFKKLTS